ncbi:MAG TPA: hypothetical protein VNL71_21445, partial [Chloroflexota bacterium]|nr:hypothetical protein [Chloroflexota bacterium]
QARVLRLQLGYQGEGDLKHHTLTLPRRRQARQPRATFSLPSLLKSYGWSGWTTTSRRRIGGRSWSRIPDAYGVTFARLARRYR